MIDHADRLPLAEIIQGTPQDLAALQVVGDAAISEVDAVMPEQSVLSRYLKMISSGQGLQAVFC